MRRSREYLRRRCDKEFCDLHREQFTHTRENDTQCKNRQQGHPKNTLYPFFFPAPKFAETSG